MKGKGLSAIFRFLCLILIMAFCTLSVACSDGPQKVSDYERAMSARKSSDWDQVVHYLEIYFREATDNNPEQRLNSWYTLVDALTSTAQIDYALSCLDLMKVEYVMDEEVILNVLERQGYLLERVGDTEESAAAWIEVINRKQLEGEEAAQIYQKIAFSYQKVAEFEIAEEMFTKALELTSDPNREAESLYYLAEIALIRNEQENSLRYAHEAEEIEDISPELESLIFYLLGDLYSLKKDTEKAKDYFKESQRFHPNMELVVERISILEQGK